LFNNCRSVFSTTSFSFLWNIALYLDFHFTFLKFTYNFIIFCVSFTYSWNEWQPKVLESPSYSVALLSVRIVEPISINFRISASNVTSLPELCLGSPPSIYTRRT
jgi:hypothetical protein